MGTLEDLLEEDGDNGGVFGPSEYFADVDFHLAIEELGSDELFYPELVHFGLQGVDFVREGTAAEEHELYVVGEEGVLLIEVEEVEQELHFVLELYHFGV